MSSTDWDGRCSAGLAELRARWIADPDPGRRRFAIEDAYWNEPHDLLPALCEALRDPDPDVATEAARALVYQPSVMGFRALREARRSDEVGEEVEAARAEMGDDLARSAGRAVGAAGARLARWLAPIADGLPRIEPGTPAAPARQPARIAPVDLGALAARLDDPDAEEQAELLRWALWLPPDVVAAVPFAERPSWIRRFLEHPDPVVRGAGGRWCGLWQEGEALAALAADAHAGVRKFATYALRELPPQGALADVAWAAMLRPGTANAAMVEAIEGWLHHAPPDATRLERLVGLRSSASLAARCQALRSLGQLGALEGVAPCWTPGPGESVAEVCAWLRACRAAGVRVPVPTETLALDSLWVQLELDVGD